MDDLYRRLQQHLDRMPVGYPATESGVEIRILERLFSAEEAEVALELSIIPEPARTIQRRLWGRFPAEQVAQALETMAARGVINCVPSGKGPRYGKLMFAIGMYERQLKRLTPELERDSRQYMEEAFHAAFHTGKTRQMRTVPVHQAVPVTRAVARYDDIRSYVAQVEGPFASMECICRKGKALTGEPCRHTTRKDNCLTIGPAAQMMVDVGQAEFITREQMLATLDEADREGLVLQPENTQKPLFVCCCCGCCCGVLTSGRRLPQPADFFHATHFAEVDPERCDVCGVCETRCPMDAYTRADEKPQVQQHRCIGCGLCVTTCPQEAIAFRERPGAAAPPEDSMRLYARLLADRYGKLGVAAVVAKRLMGVKT